MIELYSISFCSWSHHVRTLCFFFATLCLLACSDSSNGLEEITTPHVGSIFVVDVSQHHVGTDSVLKQKLQVAVGVTEMVFEGKEHVVQFAADTILSLMAYESNGDISVYARQEYIGLCFVDGGWLRFPFGGQTVVSDTLTGVPVNFTDGVKNCMVTWNARPDSSEWVLIQGKEVEAKKVRGELVVCSDSAGTIVPLQGLEFSTAYAPELSYVVREEIVSLMYGAEGPDTLGTSRRVLTSWQAGKSNAD